MDTKTILDLQRKLNGDPDNGVEPSLTLDKLEAESPEQYAAMRPYLSGMEEWPEADATDATDTDTSTADAEAAAAAEAEAAAAAAAPVVREQDAPAVVEARDRVSMREKALADYDAKVAELRAVLDEAEPEDEFSDDHKSWRTRQRKASSDLLTANSDFNRQIATAENEVHTAVVRKSEFADTIRSVGESFPELTLKRPYEVMEREYNEWAVRALAIAETQDIGVAFAKFQSDPEFTKKCGALPDGHETLFIYMNAVAKQKKEGGPLKGHIIAMAEEDGVFKKSRATVATAKSNAEKTAEALNRRDTEARPASVKGGSGEAPVAIVRPTEHTTTEQDMAWLASHQEKLMNKTPRTAAQIEEDNHLQTIVKNKWAETQARPFHQ